MSARRHRGTAIGAVGATVLCGLALATGVAHGDDDPGEQPANATADAPEVKSDDAPADTDAAPLSFNMDLDAAADEARERQLPLLVIAVPDWYDGPETKRLHETILASAAARDGLAGFVRAIVSESPDREVHTRHRVKLRGYPLAVVLGPDGGFLGSVAGLPEGDDAAETWVESVSAIPARHARMVTLRAELDDGLERPTVLLALARLHVEAGEPDRADALLARADPESGDDTEGVLGDVRYVRLTIANTKLLRAHRPDDVDALCRKWLRRFREHAHRPDVRLLRANALYLSGKKDEARTLWKAIVKDHEKTPAAKKATGVLAELASD